MSTRSNRRPVQKSRSRPARSRGRSSGRRVTGNDVPPIVFVGFIAVSFVWAAVHTAYLWLARHWYVDVVLVLVIVLVVYTLISKVVRDRRVRQERLARLRYTPMQIDGMTPTEFELACRDLMRRDGLRAERVGGSNDQAVDVNGRDHLGRVVVVQCKHTIRNANVGVGVLYAVNGTARPVHDAHLVVIATNGGFTREARAWAPKHQIHLLDRDKFIRWSQDGHTLHAVLGLPSPASGRNAGQVRTRLAKIGAPRS
jgi:restriction system protein